MSNTTQSELLAHLEQARDAIQKTVNALNETGDYESEILDDATTQAERVMRLISMVYSELNQ